MRLTLEEAEYDGWTRDQLIEEILTLTDERDFAYAHVDSWKAVLATANAQIERLAKDRDAARLEVADVRTRLAERDAQVGRLTKRLSEGLG